jgi:hypothetical protein
MHDKRLVHADSVRLTYGIQTASQDLTSNSNCEMTFKAADYAAYHFGVADEGVSVLDLQVDL